MHKPATNHLLQLISTLTKGEKKHFRLLVTRHQTGDAPLFLQLFNLLDKYKIYDEKLIFKRIPKIKKQQLSNLKSNLYKQLLSSLRILNRTQKIDLKIREQLDYARLLYNKGLYHQSLDILAKTKTKAYYLRQLVLILEIIAFEKRIESQYITRSIKTRADELAAESRKVNQILCQEHELSDLSLLLYGQYLKTGFSRTTEEIQALKAQFDNQLSSYSPFSLSFYGQLYLFQSYIWYYHIQQNFKGCYRYARKWVNLFEYNPEMKFNDCPLYIKGLHNLLSSLFNLRDYPRFIIVLEELEQFSFPQNQHYSIHEEGILCLFRYTHRIGKHFMEGSFTKGTEWVHELVLLIEHNPYNWDAHRVMVFYYKIASLYFGSGQPQKATIYLNKIINHKKQSIREDIQCFTRLLNLIAHYELGNNRLIEYQIRSVYRFLSKMKNLNQVQRLILIFLQKIPHLISTELPPAFIKLHQELKKLEEDPNTQRSFLYLDLLSWLESKIKAVSVEQIIQEKFKNSLLSK